MVFLGFLLSYIFQMLVELMQASNMIKPRRIHLIWTLESQLIRHAVVLNVRLLNDWKIVVDTFLMHCC
jgi:hypothetical protein